MKTIDFNEYQKKRSSFVRRRAELGTERAPGRRPRDKTERGLLLRLNVAGWQRWLAEGKLKKLRPRTYRVL